MFDLQNPDDRDAWIQAEYDAWHEKARGLRHLLVFMLGTAAVVGALVWAAVTFWWAPSRSPASRTSSPATAWPSSGTGTTTPPCRGLSALWTAAAAASKWRTACSG